MVAATPSLVSICSSLSASDREREREERHAVERRDATATRGLILNH